MSAMRQLALLGIASAFTLHVACDGSSADGGGGALSSGGTPSDAGLLPLLDGGDGGDGGACPPAPTLIIEAAAGSIDVSGDAVVFMDYAAGVDFLDSDKTRAIRTVKLDGSQAAVLYTAVAKHQINDVKTVGATVYFLESERDEFGNEPTSLFSIPLAGGTPTLVGKHADPDTSGDFDRLDAIVAADADSVTVVRGRTVGASLWRFSVAGGVESKIFAGIIISKPQKVGEEFIFSSNDPALGFSNYPSVVRVAAAGGSLVAVGAAKCKDALVAGSFGILCAGASETMNGRVLSRWDLSGNGHLVVFELPDEGPRGSVAIGPSDGTSVYAKPDIQPGQSAPLSRAAFTGGPAAVVACDRQEIRLRKSETGQVSNGAYQAELDMVMTATELVWVENRKTKTEPVETTGIYRTAR